MICRIVSSSLKASLVNYSRPASYRQLRNVQSSLLLTYSPVTATVDSIPAQFKRNFSNGGRQDTEIPPLMTQSKRVIVPNVFKSIGNFFQTILIIKPYFDSDFTLTEFIAGTKQAIQVISHQLSLGDTASLEGLVEREALQEIKTNLCFFTSEQRRMLAVDSEDIFFTFPYKVIINIF